MKPFSALVLCNSPRFLRMANRYLKEESDDQLVAVGAAQGGEQALNLAQALRPEVILLDPSIPGSNRRQSIPLFRKMLPEARIVVLGSPYSDSRRQPALAAGADDFVSEIAMNTLLPSLSSASDSC